MDKQFSKGKDLESDLFFPQHPDEARIETIPNRWSEAHFEVTISCDEFTCICPITAQPDYAQIHIHYIPKEYLLEAKSLKSYLASYRNVAIFHEFVVNKIRDDLTAALNPHFIEIKGDFTPRGGIKIVTIAKWGDHP
ncbi:MAG: hypothetical protein Tsb0021_12490 [Chlamydiales bacterium]